MDDNDLNKEEDKPVVVDLSLLDNHAVRQSLYPAVSFCQFFD
jgi:hypothetical protein